ncbi:hypothetical protein MHYP_G00051420 [Metynnis hypsauchen]
MKQLPGNVKEKLQRVHALSTLKTRSPPLLHSLRLRCRAEKSVSHPAVAKLPCPLLPTPGTDVVRVGDPRWDREILLPRQVLSCLSPPPLSGPISRLKGWQLNGLKWWRWHSLLGQRCRVD